MRLGPTPEVDEIPGQFWIDFIRDTAPVFRKPTIEQLGEFIAPTWQRPGRRRDVRPSAPDRDHRRAGARRHRRGQRRRVSRRIAASGRPWVRIASCNPPEIKDAAVPPFSSGYPAADRRRLAGLPRRGPSGRTRDMWEDFDAFCREHGDAGLTLRPRIGPDFIAESPWLNLYSYPAEVDYARERPLGPTWHRLDSTVRAPETTWELPAHLPEPGRRARSTSPWAASVRRTSALMQRLVDLLATTEHRVIVSKGPLADQITLHDNQVGRGLPAPAGDPARRRPGHHPRRQQHRHRGVPPRQADDRAAAVLGPGRQRPARRRDRLRPAPGDLRLPRRGADRRHRRAARRTGRSARRLDRDVERIKATKGTVRAADLIERVGRDRRAGPDQIRRRRRPRPLAGTRLRVAHYDGGTHHPTRHRSRPRRDSR